MVFGWKIRPMFKDFNNWKICPLLDFPLKKVFFKIKLGFDAKVLFDPCVGWFTEDWYYWKNKNWAENGQGLLKKYFGAF